MSFFKCFKQYSTAEKIIKRVSEKLDELYCQEEKSNLKASMSEGLQHAKAGCEEKGYVFAFARNLCLDGSSQLKNVLGDVLKDALPDSVYRRYQLLNTEEKEAIREKIATEYVRLIEKETQEFKVANFKHVIYKTEGNAELAYYTQSTYQCYSSLTPPNKFSNKRDLKALLEPILSSVAQSLLPPASESVLQLTVAHRN